MNYNFTTSVDTEQYKRYNAIVKLNYCIKKHERENTTNERVKKYKGG